MTRTTLRRNLWLSMCALALAATLFTSPRAEAQEDRSGGPIRLVVKADDMGAAHGINVATIRAYKEGIVRVTDLIVPGPWLLEAVKLLKENPGLDAGVHLTLTSEWESYKWRPLTGGRSFVDLNGYFFPMTRPREDFPPGTSLAEATLDLKEVERELRAQIEMAKRLIPRVSFLAAHMGAARFTPQLAALSDKLSKEYGLPFYNTLPGVQGIGRIYNQTDTGRAKAIAIAEKLETLGPGTWYMIDHAATDTPEMQAIGHHGYRDVAADRAGVVQAWTSERVKKVIKRRGIKLINFRDVIQEQRR